MTQFFHEPFAWFGDRTAFRGFGPDTDFLPTDRKLEKGMPVILDIAPIRDGYAADIGYLVELRPQCGRRGNAAGPDGVPRLHPAGGSRAQAVSPDLP